MGLVIKTKKNKQWIRIWLGEKLIGEIKAHERNSDKSYYLNLELDETVRIERVYSDDTRNLEFKKKQGEE